MTPTSLACLAAVGAVLGGATGAVALGRRALGRGRPALITVFVPGPGEISLPASERTAHPGTFGLWLEDRHVRVGEVLSRDERRVVRRLLDPLPSGWSGEGRWTGHVFPTATSISLDARDVVIDSPTGPAPAWLIPPASAERSSTWAIHVHGIRTTRVTALRSVPVARRLGLTSLVPSYRGDGEGPATSRSLSTLGLLEWRDIDAAMGYARDHGAERTILFGWSMGATVALLAAERSEHRDLLAGLVLLSPATDWRAVLRQGARSSRLPAAVGDLVRSVLSNGVGARLVGLTAGLDFDELDWTSRARVAVPTLVLHSSGDTEIPLEMSRRFAAAQRDVTLVELAPAAHAWEYNVDPARFDQAIARWVEQLS